MVAVVLSPALRSKLDAAGFSEKICDEGGVTTAPHGALLAVGESLIGREVHLCHGDAAAAHAPPPKRCPELDARVRALQARLEEAKYSEIIADVARGSSGHGDAADAVRQLRDTGPQLSVAANVVVTMATCFAAGYFLAKSTTGSQTAALAAGVLGLIGAMGVEVVLVLTRMYSIEKAADKAERRKQRKISRAAKGDVKGKME